MSIALVFRQPFEQERRSWSRQRPSSYRTKRSIISKRALWATGGSDQQRQMQPPRMTVTSAARSRAKPPAQSPAQSPVQCLLPLAHYASALRPEIPQLCTCGLSRSRGSSESKHTIIQYVKKETNTANQTTAGHLALSGTLEATLLLWPFRRQSVADLQRQETYETLRARNYTSRGSCPSRHPN